MKIKVGLNGFGRIGRAVLRIAQEGLQDNIEIVAINARSSAHTLAHLFTYDSCYGTYKGNVEVKDDTTFSVNSNDIKIVNFDKPEQIPWKELGVDIVIENTGMFTTREQVGKHIDAGAKKVIITSPGKDEDLTIVLGVNEEKYDNDKHHIISNASCTTNCLAPVAKILDKEFGIKKGLMTTIHSYTNDQRILDKNHKDLRRARAAAESMIPTTTGAAKAVSKVLPQLEGKLNGFSVRVPTPTVSIVDLVCELEKDVIKDDVNSVLEKASKNSLKDILGYSDKPLVSIDYKGDSRSSIIDGLSTMVIDKNMVKIIAWYDNEWGYSCRTVDLINFVANKL